VDDTRLDESTGYVEYTAGRASLVDWTGVENKPASYPPSQHGNAEHSTNYTTANRSWSVGTVTSVTGGDGLSGSVTGSGALAVDSSVVRTSGAQTIGGVKTFSDIITGNISGNAGTASTLETARNINGISFNGSSNITITANTPNTLARGTGLTGNNFNGSAGTTWAVAYGTVSGTACQGNDSRLSDARTPVSHTHGNLTNDGKVGSTSDQVVTTTTGGAVTTSSRSGIDSRATFPPSSHTLAAHSDVGGFSNTLPLAAGSASQGTSSRVSREDHVHPDGGVGLIWISIATSTTAQHNRGYLLTNSLTLTLPASPSIGDQVGWKNISGTHTISRNGSKIQGVEADYTVSTPDLGELFVYTGSTLGWVRGLDNKSAEEAPADSKLYGRKDKAWEEIAYGGNLQPRRVTHSTSDPTGGSDGDIWLKYTAE